MEKKTFEEQVERLKAAYGGERSYPEGRVKLLWRSLEKTADSIFVAAVDDLILNFSAAPMGKKILEAVDAARALDAESRAEWCRTDAYKRDRQGFMGVIEDLAERSAEVQGFAKECTTLLARKVRGEISREDFDENVKLLEVAARASTPACALCGKSGLVVTDAVRRCKCLAGQRISERAYAATRGDGAREYVVIPTIS